jgi:hypothetical protein
MFRSHSQSTVNEMYHVGTVEHPTGYGGLVLETIGPLIAFKFFSQEAIYVSGTKFRQISKL